MNFSVDKESMTIIAKIKTKVKIKKPRCKKRGLRGIKDLNQCTGLKGTLL